MDFVGWLKRKIPPFADNEEEAAKRVLQESRRSTVTCDAAVVDLAEQDAQTGTECMLEQIESDIQKIDGLMQEFQIIREDGRPQAGPLKNEPQEEETKEDTL